MTSACIRVGKLFSSIATYPKFRLEKRVNLIKHLLLAYLLASTKSGRRVNSLVFDQRIHYLRNI